VGREDADSPAGWSDDADSPADWSALASQPGFITDGLILLTSFYDDNHINFPRE